MAVAGREGHEGAVDCPVDVHDTFDVSLVATDLKVGGDTDMFGKVTDICGI